MEKPVIVFGTGTLSITALNIFYQNDVIVYGILDDDPVLQGKEFMESSVLSSTEDDNFLKFIGTNCESFVALEDLLLRKRIVKLLNEERKVMPINALHPYSQIAKSVEIGHGNLIDAGTVVGAMATISSHCILSANASIGPKVIIGDYAQIGSGVIIGAEVTIGNDVFIGSGAVIVSGVSIENGARIGAGSVVVSSVKKNTTVFGNPAKIISGTSDL